MRTRLLLASAISTTALLAAGCACHPFHKPTAVVSSSPVCCTPAPGCAEGVPPAPVPAPVYAPPPTANIGGPPR